MKAKPTPVTKAIEKLGGAVAGHARLSPSGSKRWLACPGSIVLESFVPNKSTTYSDDGTACHDVGARCLLSSSQAAEFVDEYIPVHKEGEPERKVKFTEDMADLTQVYVDSIRAKARLPGVQVWIETKVEFSEWVQVPGQFGTADAILLLPVDGDPMTLELDMDDAKFGSTPVPVQKNPQLMTYALGTITKLGAEYNPKTGFFELLDGRVITQIRLSIHQPKLQADALEWTCTPAELMLFGTRLRSGAVSVENAAQHYKKIPMAEWNKTYLNPTPNEGECAFCRVMATCPSVAKQVRDKVGSSFHVIEDFAPITPSAMDLPTLSQSMSAAGLIEDWIKAVRGEVERRLLAGEEVPDWGLELGKKGNRKFTDEEAAENMLRKTFRLKIEDVYDLKLKSPTQLEKLTKSRNVDGEEIPAPMGERQWGKLKALITQADPKPSVKHTNVIKAPYVVPAISADAFEAVPESEDDEQLY